MIITATHLIPKDTMFLKEKLKVSDNWQAVRTSIYL